MIAYAYNTSTTTGNSYSSSTDVTTDIGYILYPIYYDNPIESSDLFLFLTPKEILRLLNLKKAQAVLKEWINWKMPKSPVEKRRRKNNRQMLRKRRHSMTISGMGEILLLIIIAVCF